MTELHTDDPTGTSVTGSESHADGQTIPPEGIDTGEQENGSQESEPQKTKREERFRKERNEAVAERDALAQRIEQFQRAEVERLAADALAMPGDLFSLSGNELADYLTEDGNVDQAKVSADVAALLVERPGLRKQHTPGFDPTQGTGGRPPKAKPTFGDIFKS